MSLIYINNACWLFNNETTRGHIQIPYMRVISLWNVQEKCNHLQEERSLIPYGLIISSSQITSICFRTSNRTGDFRRLAMSQLFYWYFCSFNSRIWKKDTHSNRVYLSLCVNFILCSSSKATAWSCWSIFSGVFFNFFSWRFFLLFISYIVWIVCNFFSNCRLLIACIHLSVLDEKKNRLIVA